MAAIAKFISYDGGIAFSETVVKFQKRDRDGKLFPLDEIVSMSVRKPQQDVDGFVRIVLQDRKMYRLFFKEEQLEEAAAFKKQFDALTAPARQDGVQPPQPEAAKKGAKKSPTPAPEKMDAEQSPAPDPEKKDAEQSPAPDPEEEKPGPEPSAPGGEDAEQSSPAPDGGKPQTEDASPEKKPAAKAHNKLPEKLKGLPIAKKAGNKRLLRYLLILLGTLALAGVLIAFFHVLLRRPA